MKGTTSDIPSPDPRDQAKARMTAYFRMLGVHDAHQLKAAVDRVFRRVQSRHPNAAGEALVFAAVDDARQMVRAWLARLVETGQLAEPTALTTGLLIWRVRAALTRYPQAFLKLGDDLPEGFRRMIAGEPLAMTPAPLPGEMDARRIEPRSVKLPQAVRQPMHQLSRVATDLVLNVVVR